jgi:hypothetical protein
MLSSFFPLTPVDKFITKCAEGTVNPPAVVPMDVDVQTIESLLDKLGYDHFHLSPARLPRRPPNDDEWKRHLDQVTSHLQLRTFDMDSADLVECMPELGEEPCANGESGQCIGTSCSSLISGLSRPGGIVLRRISQSADPEEAALVKHPPYCVLCLRNLVAEYLNKDRYHLGLLGAASQISRPGIDYQHKAVTPVQTFFNLRDCPGGYDGRFVLTSEEGDILIQPVARLNLSYLRAVQDEETGRWRILQDAIKFNIPSNTIICQPKPGETVSELLQRVSPQQPDRNN